MLHQEEVICKELMDKMITRRICKPFTTLEQLPSDYVENTEVPIDLNTIQSKLNSGSYLKVTDWIADVEHLWNNAITHFDETHMLHAIACEMQQWFRRKIAREKWTAKDTVIDDIQKALTALHDILSNSPSFE